MNCPSSSITGFGEPAYCSVTPGGVVKVTVVPCTDASTRQREGGQPVSGGMPMAQPSELSCGTILGAT